MKDVCDLGWIESVPFETATSRRMKKQHTFVKAKVSSGEAEKGERKEFDEKESLKRVNMHIVKCPNLLNKSQRSRKQLFILRIIFPTPNVLLNENYSSVLAAYEYFPNSQQ